MRNPEHLCNPVLELIVTLMVRGGTKLKVCRRRIFVKRNAVRRDLEGWREMGQGWFPGLENLGAKTQIGKGGQKLKN